MSRDITIQRVLFTVSAPFAEGHTCSEAEAHALNQVRSENVRNNMASKVKAAWAEAGEGAETLDSATLSELAATVAAYDADYVFNMASAGGGKTPRDPIAAESTKMAKAAVAGKLKSMGVTLKAYLEVEANKEKYANAVASLASSDVYMKAAKKAVADREKLASADIDALAL